MDNTHDHFIPENKIKNVHIQHIYVKSLQLYISQTILCDN